MVQYKGNHTCLILALGIGSFGTICNAICLFQSKYQNRKYISIIHDIEYYDNHSKY